MVCAERKGSAQGWAAACRSSQGGAEGGRQAFAHGLGHLQGCAGDVAGSKHAGQVGGHLPVHGHKAVFRGQAGQKRVRRNGSPQNEHPLAGDGLPGEPYALYVPGAQNLAHTAVHKGNGRVQLRRALRGHKGDGAADAGQKIGLVGGIRRKPPHNHRLAAVEHSVTGGAVTHAPAQKFGLAGDRRRFGHTAGQNQAAGVQNVSAEVDQKAAAQGHQVGHPALLGLNAKRAGVGGKGLQHGRTG